MTWSPLAGGLLTGKFSPDGKGPEDSRRSKIDFPVVDKGRAFHCVEAMHFMAQQRGVSIARIALVLFLCMVLFHRFFLTWLFQHSQRHIRGYCYPDHRGLC
jgi:hypothetical protein